MIASNLCPGTVLSIGPRHLASSNTCNSTNTTPFVIAGQRCWPACEKSPLLYDLTCSALHLLYNSTWDLLYCTALMCSTLSLLCSTLMYSRTLLYSTLLYSVLLYSLFYIRVWVLLWSALLYSALPYSTRLFCSGLLCSITALAIIDQLQLMFLNSAVALKSVGADRDQRPQRVRQTDSKPFLFFSKLTHSTVTVGVLRCRRSWCWPCESPPSIWYGQDGWESGTRVGLLT
jgi:hypothetical protein